MTVEQGDQVIDLLVCIAGMLLGVAALIGWLIGVTSARR